MKKIGCDFVILTVLDEEFDAMIRALKIYGNIIFHHRPIVYCEIVLLIELGIDKFQQLKGLVVSIDGMGRVEGAIKVQQVFSFFDPKAFFLVGLAGGVDKNNVALGDIIVANNIIDYEYQRINLEDVDIRWRIYKISQSFSDFAAISEDTWFSMMDPEYQKLRVPKVHFGSVLSGDKVIASPFFFDRFLEKDSSIVGVEMEGAGIALFLERYYYLDHFFMIRGVSDLANSSKRTDSLEWSKFACDASAVYTVTLILYLASIGYFLRVEPT